MGDSLKNARIFVNSCEEAISTLADAPRDAAIEALSTIQSGAKLNHARAIYRAAQDTLSALSTGKDAPNRLASLTQLIKQYEQGLIELEPQSEEPKAAETEPTRLTDVVDTPIDAAEIEDLQRAQMIAPAVVQLSEEALQARAMTALNDTLDLARDEERAPLETLKNMATEIKNEIPVDMKTTPREPSKIALETLIQDVVQQGLSYARQSELTLSFSYDMGAVVLPFEKAYVMKRRMERWVGHLVNHLMAQNDPNGLAHIDLSATPSSIRIATSAPALPDAVLNTSPDKALIRQDFERGTQKLSLYLSLTEGRPAPIKPRKIPVEEGLARRLDALLSENTPQETNVLDFDEAAAKRRASL